MRITDVRTFVVDCSIPPEHRVRSGAGLKLARQAAFLEVSTDTGITGTGPCSFGSANLALAGVIALVENLIKPLVVGKDPFDTAALWSEVYYGVLLRVLGNRSIGVAILSGLDIALWDIKGKALGVPVYQLLGGVYRREVPLYASSIYWNTPERAAELALRYRTEGYRAVKVKVGADYRNDLACVAAIRAAVGQDMDIMVDANMCYTTDLAIQVGRQLDRYGVYWFEEPLSIDDVSGHARLAQALDVRIATGENMYTRWHFMDFLKQGGVEVIQADCSRVGGITEGVRLAHIASGFDVAWAPHTFGDVVTVVANLHAVAATPNAIILENDVTYNPLMTHLAKNPPAIVGGRMRLPEGPGLGLELDEEFIRAHPYRGEPGIGLGARPAWGLACDAPAGRRAT